MKKTNKQILGVIGTIAVLVIFSLIINRGLLGEKQNVKTSVLTSPYLERPIDGGDTESSDEIVPPPPTGAYDYSYSYYISANQPAATEVTKPSVTPCQVGEQKFFMAGGPESAYCKHLQALASQRTGGQAIFSADIAPEMPQTRYAVALAILRSLQEVGGQTKTNDKLASNWYYHLNDATEIHKASKQELADFRMAYASGILTGRINPENRSQVTLAPLDKISYIELMAMFQKNFVNGRAGGNSTIKQENLPGFITTRYQKDHNWLWIAEAYSFAVDYGIINKDEFNETTLFNYATRADMVNFMARLQAGTRERATFNFLKP